MTRVEALKAKEKSTVTPILTPTLTQRDKSRDSSMSNNNTANFNGFTGGVSQNTR